MIHHVFNNQIQLFNFYGKNLVSFIMEHHIQQFFYHSQSQLLCLIFYTGIDHNLHKVSFLIKTPSILSPLLLAVSCRKQDGGQADVEACLKFASSMPPLTQLCQLPCQEDCQLSSWSKFSSCTADCVGVRIRKRMLVGE